MRKGYLPVAVIMTALTALVHMLPARAQMLLKPNDRVVFYGDSITEQRLYTRYVQQYIQCRYPDLKVRFFNAGWSGDTAPGARGRLERDVLSLNPTVVTLYFGMNDGGYRPVAPDIVKRYRDGMERIIKELTSRGIRVVVFTPGAVDYDKRPQLRDAKYNENLAELGKAGAELADQYKLPFWNVIEPMIKFQDAQKAKNAAFTMIPDAVHPSPAGHLVVAYEMLKGLGAEKMPELGIADVNRKTGTGLKVVSATPQQVELENDGPSYMPYWYENGLTDVARASGFASFSAQKLIVTGLNPGSYDLAINGTKVGCFEAGQFAAGVNVEGNSLPDGRLLYESINRKEDNYFTAWRWVKLPLAKAEGSSEVVDSLMGANEAFQKLIFNLAKPRTKVNISLTLAPEAVNLAQGKPYVSSDPNRFNWGTGGLTDGSWAPTDKTCFATGDAATFPKYVTVDLGEVQALGSLALGVPPFGSTKTVEASLSIDGQTFTKVGEKVFQQRKEERATIAFAATNARYVRLTFKDKYEQTVVQNPNFAFITELEVYRAR